MTFVTVGIVAGGAAIVGGVGKAITAKQLKDKQNDLAANLKESTYISPALLEATANAKKRATVGQYAGQEQDVAALDKNAANALSNAQRGSTSGTDIVNTAMQVQGNKNAALQNIARNQQAFNQQGNNDFNNMLLKQAGQEAENHQQYLAAKSALQGAAMQNDIIAQNAWWNLGSDGFNAAAPFLAMKN